MRTRHWLLLSTSLLMPLAHVAAHHSPATLYDLSREITVTGIVKKFEFGNPHLRIYIDVDNNGTTETWLAEGGSRTQLARVGWTGKEVAPGDRITARGHAPRDPNEKLIHMTHLIFPDGTERFSEDVDYESFTERRRRPQ